MHKHPEEAIILSHNRLEIRWINNPFRKIIVKFPRNTESMCNIACFFNHSFMLLYFNADETTISGSLLLKNA